MNELHETANAQALATIRARLDSEWVGVEQAMRVLNVGRDECYELAHSCAVIAERSGKGWKFYLPSLWDYNHNRAMAVLDEQAAIRRAAGI